jgi:hypothetical protein
VIDPVAGVVLASLKLDRLFHGFGFVGTGDIHVVEFAENADGVATHDIWRLELTAGADTLRRGRSMH